MRNYSENELRGIFGMVEDARFNAVRLLIITDDRPPLATTITDSQKRSELDAELGGNPQRSPR
jgi:hypothetical protein